MLNIPDTGKKRIVIVGCGFAGLTVARKLKNSGYQVVIIDKHNYHQFPPLFYQVASAGLDESSILFPLRKIFQNYSDYYIRKAEVKSIDPLCKKLVTSGGIIRFDFLLLAHGATNSFFGSIQMQQHSKAMKTIAEVIDLRNSLLMNFENALIISDESERESYLNIVIIGGGPSGVEIAGALAEMNKHIIPKDYPELRTNGPRIFLIEAADRLLNMMSAKSSAKAQEFLENSGVKVMTTTKAVGCDDDTVYIDSGNNIKTKMIIWTAGIKGNIIDGLNNEVYTRSGRIIVDRKNQIKGYEDIFAIGDIAWMAENKYPKGHPQVAQVAIQQAKLLAENLKCRISGRSEKEFHYRDLGTMATIGRHLAVVELPFVNFQGIFAWYVWMFIHLMSIVGVRNKLIVFFNWAWKYLTYDQSTRLILRPKGYS
ncbi:MAG: NADH dehydrogenase [Bacteroidetes bacterium GWE2_41_25]|nr:MAG: NADH dehydrogenase [Bacteroidetes bacterium GWE2_41_25]OFX95047.1 MAG: NADH dehydrogenase [Bacteroidetes bacterium GWC2_40_22]OFY59954.1 MAG: NADH dehydrogenase [Bacteroidetes bacterium GWF2_41_9]HBH84959.1 FAD-dependent oxidoreductase [Bacteroidales bacterium]HCU19412.1 FAD-dependent oxidoreductase [Bacteroidales bacterium]